MIKSLSKKIAHFFCAKGIVSKDEIDAYAYGYEILIMSAINWGIIFLMMIATRYYIETIFYVITVVLMRHHAGGYHAETHLMCGIMSIASYLAIILIVMFVPAFLENIILLTTLLVSLLIIVKLAPVSHKNNPVSIGLRRKHRVYSLILLGCFSVLVILLQYFRIHSLSLCISLALFQVSISLLLGIHKNMKKEG